ncbi:MAG: hypothetical protein J0J13_03285, partial [Devosia sp.]|nr:hypothetical protein [Devosia sp.]
MNAIVRELDAYQALMKQWFEHLHRHPEPSAPATQTAAFIAETLRSFGVHGADDMSSIRPTEAQI